MRVRSTRAVTRRRAEMRNSARTRDAGCTPGCAPTCAIAIGDASKPASKRPARRSGDTLRRCTRRFIGRKTARSCNALYAVQDLDKRKAQTGDSARMIACPLSKSEILPPGQRPQWDAGHLLHTTPVALPHLRRHFAQKPRRLRRLQEKFSPGLTVQLPPLKLHLLWVDFPAHAPIDSSYCEDCHE